MADAQQEGTPLAEQAKQQASQAVQQGRQAAGHVWELARTEFRNRLSGQKDNAAQSVSDFAELIRTAGQQLKEQGKPSATGYADQIADRLQGFAGSVHDKDIEELIADTETFARERPALFLGIAAFLGFALARFLKSSGTAAAAA